MITECHGQNKRIEMANTKIRHPDALLSPYLWTSSCCGLPSSISSNPSRGCLFLMAVEVRVGVGGMLFSWRLSSWDEEISSLCRLEGTARKWRHIFTADQVLPQTIFYIFKTCPGFGSGKLRKKGMENLYGLIRL